MSKTKLSLFSLHILPFPHPNISLAHYPTYIYTNCLIFPSLYASQAFLDNSRNRNSNQTQHYFLGCLQFSHSVVSDSATPWTTVRQASLSITNSWNLPKLMSTESVMTSSHLILCHPLLLLPSIFPSIRVFSNESAFHIRWPKYWSFSFNISPSNEHPGLISFRTNWLDLLAVQGTLKSLLQYHSSKASILRCSAFFIIQLSHPYMTTGKTIALTRRPFVGKVMSLLFNMLTVLSQANSLMVTEEHAFTFSQSMVSST